MGPGETYHEDNGEISLDTDYQFHSLLEEDRTVAIFQGDIAEEYHSLVYSRLQQFLSDRNTIPKILEPDYWIQVHHDLNDSPIPSLTLDAETMRLSFKWKDMYTRFYGEEIMYHKGLEGWSANNEELKKDLANKMSKGEISLSEFLENTLRAFAGASDATRKAARRARIRRQFTEIGEDKGEDWNVEQLIDTKEEERVLRRLHDARHFASMEEDSEFDSDEGDVDEEDEEWEDVADDDAEDRDSDEGEDDE